MMVVVEAQVPTQDRHFTLTREFPIQGRTWPVLLVVKVVFLEVIGPIITILATLVEVLLFQTPLNINIQMI